MGRAAGIVMAASGIVSFGCEPPDVSVVETPIQITAETTGYGPPVQDGDVVKVDYRVTLPDGREVLNEREYLFRVGFDTVIRGVDEAVLGMKAGGRRTFICPPHKHWGRKGYANLIPAATDVTIELTLLEIQARSRMRVGVSGE